MDFPKQSLENYWPFKYKIQKLIDAGVTGRVSVVECNKSSEGFVLPTDHK